MTNTDKQEPKFKGLIQLAIEHVAIFKDMTVNTDKLIPGVDKIKSAYAAIIDHLDDVRKNSGNPEKKRLASVAITEAQTAQMWAVKAITAEE